MSQAGKKVKKGPVKGGSAKKGAKPGLSEKREGLKIFCDIRKCVACKACELACAVEHSKDRMLFETIKETPLPKKRRHVSDSYEKTLSVACQHCDDAPCIAACMSGALYKDEKGATMHDKDKCVGCWMCIMVCPFGAIARRVEEKIAIKCDLCPDRDDFACVAACPTGALFAGTISEFEKKIKVSKNNK